MQRIIDPDPNSTLDPEEEDQEVEETQEPEAEESPEGDPQESDEEAVSEESDEEILYGADGKILGRFNNAAEARSYIERRDKQYGQQARELGTLRQLAQQQGWTVNKDGSIVPPAPSRGADTGTEEWQQDSDGTRYRTVRSPQGEYHTDENGAQYLTDEDRIDIWDRIAQRHTDENGDVDIIAANRDFSIAVQRIDNARLEARLRSEMSGTLGLETQHMQERQRVTETIVGPIAEQIPQIKPLVIQMVEEVNQRINSAPNKKDFFKPGVYEGVLRTYLGNMLVSHLLGEEISEEEAAGDPGAVAPKAKVRTPTSRQPPVEIPAAATRTGTPPSGPPPPTSRVRITEEIRRAAEEYGIPPEKLAEKQAQRLRNSRNGRTG